MEAFVWGLFSGGALLIGAAVGYFGRLPSKVVAGVMSFGSGVLVSVLSFELMAESFREGGLWPAVIGFFAGGLLYTLANEVLAKHGARHRKRSQPPKHEREEDSGTAIALGALLDGIPESIAIGLSLLAGSGVGIAVVVGIFVSNFPEGLSSATGMKSIGKSKTYIFGLWSVVNSVDVDPGFWDVDPPAKQASKY